MGLWDRCSAAAFCFLPKTPRAKPAPGDQAGAIVVNAIIPSSDFQDSPLARTLFSMISGSSSISCETSIPLVFKTDSILSTTASTWEK